MCTVVETAAGPRHRRRRDQYRDMLRLAAAHSPRRERLAHDGVAQACAILRRHDRIEWYLRVWSRDLLAGAHGLPAFTRRQNRRLNRLLRQLGRPEPNHHYSERQAFLLTWWRLSVEAARVPFLKGWLAAFPFRRFRSFHDANRHLSTYTAGAARVRDHQTLVDDFLVFGDGWKWVLAPYESSKIEGQLMRHCGNVGTRDPDLQFLSLRSPERKAGVPFWRPHLTFTLKDGYLVEMKGRGNARPAPRHHRRIVALLLDPRIKGFAPFCGTTPTQDFTLDDLRPEDRAKVRARVPDFEYFGRVEALWHWRRFRAPPQPSPPDAPAPVQLLFPFMADLPPTRPLPPPTWAPVRPAAPAPAPPSTPPPTPSSRLIGPIVRFGLLLLFLIATLWLVAS